MWWIPFAVIGALAALVTVLLLLPVKVIIKSDDNGQLMIYYKYCFKTFGIDPDPDDPITKMLKTASGVDRLEKNELKKSIRKSGLKNAIKEEYSILIDLLKEVVALLKRCTVTKLHIKIRCVGDGPDEAAIHYGECSAATYSLLHGLQNFVKIRKRGCDIDIGCDYFGSEWVLDYEAVLAFRMSRVISSFWRVAMAEAKRENDRKH